MTLAGIDVSIYQNVISEVAWRCMYLDGQRVAVVGSAHPQTNPYASTNFANAQAAGFQYLATYLALAPTISGLETVRRAKQACASFWPQLCFVGVDCEVDNITKAQIQDALGAITAEGRRPVLYTGVWWWGGHFGNPTDFKDVPLWAAQYDGNPDLDVGPFGGWTGAIGKQWAGGVPLCGVDVDKSTFDQNFIEGDTMTPEEKVDFDALKAQVAKLAADMAVARVFMSIGAKALNGEAATDQEKAEAKGLLG